MLWHPTLRIITHTEITPHTMAIVAVHCGFLRHRRGITLFRIPQFYWLTILNPAGVALREYFLRLFHHDNFIISIHFIIFLESMLPFLFSMKLSHIFSDIIKASRFWTMRIYLLLRSKANIHAIKRRNKINILFISHF